MAEGEITEVYDPVDSPTLGHGGFSRVYKVRRRRDKQVMACKTIGFHNYGTTEQAREDIKTEISVLSRLDHPNIIRYFDVQWGPNEARIYMEHCEDQSLGTYVAKRSLYVHRSPWARAVLTPSPQRIH